MKKVFFVLIFLFAALCCFAEENLQASESNEILPLSSSLSLSLFCFDGGFPVWEQTSFKFTPYADYQDEPPSFFQATSPTVPILIWLGAVAMFVAGLIEMDNNIDNGLGLAFGSVGFDIAALLWFCAD